MLFNSWLFLALFLPAVLIIGLGLLHGTPRIVFLVGAGFVFYAAAGAFHAVVLAIAISWVHLLVGRTSARPGVARMLAAITLPMGILFYFKYMGFFLHGILQPFGITVSVPTIDDKTLPAGVSFFTFQLMSYAIDRRRGLIDKPLGFPEFALLIGFFPHLVAGPILRYRDIAEGLRRLPTWGLRFDSVPRPITYIVLGLSFKVLLADRISFFIAPLVQRVDHLSLLDAAYVVLGYSFQIYFDFYGYSLVAIGLGLLFGLTFPANFDRPYSARNPREFWRRWHITLSFWIRDYVYFPLGGNKSYIRNILITFAVFGLWHGAGWNYVIWGLYNAMLVIVYHVARNHWERTPAVVQVLLTYVLISLGWLLFLFDFSTLAKFAIQTMHPTPLRDSLAGPAAWALLALAVAVTYGVRAERIAETACLTSRSSIAWGVGIGVIAFATALFLDLSAVFIYFRF